MEVSVTKEFARATISLRGRFDFNAHREFPAAYEKLINDMAVRTIRVDLSGVDYLDSSALGMLLVLHDKLGGVRKEVVLIGVEGNVKQVLEIANFSKLFQIS